MTTQNEPFKGRYLWTRSEALKQIATAVQADRSGSGTRAHFVWSPDDDTRARELVVALEALGVIGIEQPKSEGQLRYEALEAAWAAAGGTTRGTGPSAILFALTERGFTVARKP